MDFAGKVACVITAVTSAVIGYLVAPVMYKKEEYPEFYKSDNGEIIDYYVLVKVGGDLELDETVINRLRNNILNGDKRGVIIRSMCQNDACKNSSIAISQQDEKKDELVFIIKAMHVSGIMTTLMNLVEDSFRNIGFFSAYSKSINIKYKSKFINREISVERKIPAE